MYSTHKHTIVHTSTQ